MSTKFGTTPSLGHTKESYFGDLFLKHIAGGLDWVLAARR